MIEINEDDVRNRLETIRTQIRQAETRLGNLREEERDLEVFLRVVQRYAGYPDVNESPDHPLPPRKNETPSARCRCERH